MQGRYATMGEKRKEEICMEFDFSVIIPVYNAARYLEDAIESIIMQTVGFEHIQLILVNDGSTDESEDICLSYKEKYPENVIYCSQPNAGVSVARNHGLLHASGRYINFLDADDKWEEYAFEKAYRFLEKHQEVDVVACMLEYFDAKTGLGHPLNWKFKRDGVINIFFSPEQVQMHIASCFIRREAMTGLCFQEGLRYGEDSLLASQIIFKKKQYGILKSVHYMYRKREDESSAIDRCRCQKEFYSQTLDLFHFRLIHYIKDIWGIADVSGNSSCLPPYMQHVLMYDLQWRIKRGIPDGVLTEEEEDSYIKKLCYLLSYIPPKVILKQRNLSFDYKLIALHMQNATDISRSFEQVGGNVFLMGERVFSLHDSSILKIGYITTNSREVCIEGLVRLPCAGDCYRIAIRDNHGGEHNLCLEDYPKRKTEFVCGFYTDRYFKVSIPKKEGSILKLSFFFSYKGAEYAEMAVGFTDTCRLNTSFPCGYLRTEDNLIERKGNKIIIRNQSRRLYLKWESVYVRKLFEAGVWKIALLRILIFFLSAFQKKELWIISDRRHVAGDNGEAFFQYVCGLGEEDKEICFAISKDSPDYGRLKEIGKVIDMNSIWYKVKFLLASKIISSQAGDDTINPFGKGKKFVKDLYKFDFVFLQHGIIKDDLSSWLNRMGKDIRMFVTSAEDEYVSILKGDYFYGDDIVKLTGLPRHDGLRDRGHLDRIAIIPTWRRSLSGCTDAYSPDFKETGFFQFYNALIHDSRLLKCMEDYGCKGVFVLHPLLMSQVSHFDGNERISIEKGADYHELFETCDLLVTDYSSVFFDFAYLGKPVVYAQFDEEEFFQTHSYEKGYFDYRKDGFGEVCTTLDGTVDAIIRVIKGGFFAKNEYMQRAEKFFPARDGQNCKRVYEEICKL